MDQRGKAKGVDHPLSANWPCPSCGASVFAFRITCFKCNAPRGSASAGSAAGAEPPSGKARGVAGRGGAEGVVDLRSRLQTGHQPNTAEKGAEGVVDLRAKLRDGAEPRNHGCRFAPQNRAAKRERADGGPAPPNAGGGDLRERLKQQRKG